MVRGGGEEGEGGGGGWGEGWEGVVGPDSNGYLSHYHSPQQLT